MKLYKNFIVFFNSIRCLLVYLFVLFFFWQSASIYKTTSQTVLFAPFALHFSSDYLLSLVVIFIVMQMYLPD